MSAPRDRGPIDQQWIRDYCDKFLNIAEGLPANSPMRPAIALRIEYVQDLVEAWQKRNFPLNER